MPWLAGIDEAGYGPNLGPFVMTVMACHIADIEGEVDLWKRLKHAVRRKKDRDDGRILVEDSKVVYTSKKGLKSLERGVMSAVAPDALLNEQATSLQLAQWLPDVCPGGVLNLQEECWYCGDTKLPVAMELPGIAVAANMFRKISSDNGVRWAAARSVIVCPPRFNALLERWGSKAIVLLVSLAELLQSVMQLQPAEPVHIFVDKHGGRNFYGDVLRQSLPGGTIEPVEQGEERSIYNIAGLDRECTITFQTKADKDHFNVALASMLAKYLREVLMSEFNRFWKSHIPDLKPTAGYPVDAARFINAIRPKMKELQIAEEALWRKR